MLSFTQQQYACLQTHQPMAGCWAKCSEWAMRFISSAILVSSCQGQRLGSAWILSAGVEKSQPAKVLIKWWSKILKNPISNYHICRATSFNVFLYWEKKHKIIGLKQAIISEKYCFYEFTEKYLRWSCLFREKDLWLWFSNFTWVSLIKCGY